MKRTYRLVLSSRERILLREALCSYPFDMHPRSDVTNEDWDEMQVLAKKLVRKIDRETERLRSDVDTESSAEDLVVEAAINLEAALGSGPLRNIVEPLAKLREALALLGRAE